MSIRPPTTIHPAGGALWVAEPGGTVVVDAPAGAGPVLAQAGALLELRAVVLTSGRAEALAGLIGLLAAAAEVRRRDDAVVVFTLLGDERAPALVDAWVRGWRSHLPVALDAVAAGSTFDAGPISVQTLGLRAGELVHRPEPHVVACDAVALRLETLGGTVAVVPSCAPSTRLERVVLGCDAAIVRGAARPWPRTEVRWRLSPLEASQLVGRCDEGWVQRDDGSSADIEN